MISINNEIARPAVDLRSCALCWATSRATSGAWLARFGVVWLDLAPQTAIWAPKKTEWASNRASWEPKVADLEFKSSDFLPDRCELARPLRPARATWAPSNAQAGSIWLPTLALGALQRLAGSTWLLTNAPTTAPSTRLAKKIDVQQDVLPRRCLLRSLCNVSFMPQI